MQSGNSYATGNENLDAAKSHSHVGRQIAEPSTNRSSNFPEPDFMPVSPVRSAFFGTDPGQLFPDASKARLQQLVSRQVT
jgi:hypothetical protein